MIVDNYPVHPEVSGLKTINLQFLPPNTTSCTQPMDQGNSNRIAIECLDFTVEGLHCLKNYLITKIEVQDMEEKVELCGVGTLWGKAFFILQNIAGHYQRI